MSITVDQMRSKLLSLDSVKERLATLEPLEVTEFEVGPEVMFRVDPGWQHGVEAKQGEDLVDCFVSIRGKEYQLTKGAWLEASKIAQMSPKFTTQYPAKIVEPGVNYWFRQLGSSNKSFQLFTTNDRALSFVKQSMIPYSNLRLVDAAVEGIEEKYGKGEILVDYKFTNTLHNTYVRLIVPGARRNIIGTGIADDSWSTGIQIRNSLTAAKKPEISGYLFRWWCTNGAVETLGEDSLWDRRRDRYNNSSDQSDIYEWARNNVDAILGGLEPALDQIQRSADEEINGEQALREIFEHYNIPAKYHSDIIAQLISAPRITVYSVMQAVTRLANDLEMDSAVVDKFMRVGAEIPSHSTATCSLGKQHFN